MLTANVLASLKKYEDTGKALSTIPFCRFKVMDHPSSFVLLTIQIKT